MARITFILKPLSPIFCDLLRARAVRSSPDDLANPLSARFSSPVMVHQFLSSHESMAKEGIFTGAGTMPPRLRPCADESFCQEF
jgi:hypothetical protein